MTAKVEWWVLSAFYVRVGGSDGGSSGGDGGAPARAQICAAAPNQSGRTIHPQSIYCVTAYRTRNRRNAQTFLSLLGQAVREFLLALLSSRRPITALCFEEISF
ncbi:hypothetical protein V1477_018972 [Vespula maculifrons]